AMLAEANRAPSVQVSHNQNLKQNQHSKMIEMSNKGTCDDVSNTPTTTAQSTDAVIDNTLTGNEVVMITGSGSGIGKGTALAFAALNNQLVLIDKNADKLEETCLECEQKSPNKIKPLKLIDDVSLPDTAQNAIKTTIDTFGRLDVLINNAGITALTCFDDPQVLDVYHRVIATNMHATVYLSVAAYPHLKRTGGSIVNVSSMLDDKPARSKFAYCMSKAAITMLTKCLAHDYAPHVRVNCVSPGPIASSILDDMGINLEARRANGVKNTLVRRIGEPEDVAKMIIYLASKNKSSFITGSRVLVDGGYTLIPLEK
ncbi:Granaticin polyketide synthase putative ketoacyl reductase 2, partial [Fragariocoptes setiger]